MNRRQCATCVAWDDLSNKDAAMGLCLFNPPVWVRDDDAGAFPHTMPEDWCMKWAPRNPASPPKRREFWIMRADNAPVQSDAREEASAPASERPNKITKNEVRIIARAASGRYHGDDKWHRQPDPYQDEWTAAVTKGLDAIGIEVADE